MLDTDALGRSHRGAIGKARLREAIERTHALLGLPADYRLGIVPASDTGAMEMAIWSLLGPRPVTMLAWESFGAGWVTDVARQLKLDADNPHRRLWRNRATSTASIRRTTWSSPGTARPAACACPTPTGSPPTAPASPSATRPRRFRAGHRLGEDRCRHLQLAESARRRRPRTACSCSARAPSSGSSASRRRGRCPKIFRLTKGGKLIDGIFRGETINTPSMLCVEDWLFALDWAERIGGLDALIARADANAAALDRWVQARRLDRASRASDPAIRSNTSVCLQFADRSDAEANKARQKAIVKLLEAEDAAYDIGAYRDAPPGLRIWCGATVETADIEALAVARLGWSTSLRERRLASAAWLDCAATFREAEGK